MHNDGASTCLSSVSEVKPGLSTVFLQTHSQMREFDVIVPRRARKPHRHRYEELITLEGYDSDGSDHLKPVLNPQW